MTDVLWCGCRDTEQHCPFDHGLHQFYEMNHTHTPKVKGDTVLGPLIRGKDLDYCVKCGKKK